MIISQSNARVNFQNDFSQNTKNAKLNDSGNVLFHINSVQNKNHALSFRTYGELIRDPETGETRRDPETSIEKPINNTLTNYFSNFKIS